MELPSVVHPKLIKVNGFTFRVVSYCQLTDEQALKAAIHFCHTHKLRKSLQKGIIEIKTLFDKDSINLL